MPFDIYSTRAQLAAIEQMPREYSFMHDFFAKDGGTVDDDYAIYDYRKGSTPMAPVIHPGQGGVTMRRGGFETRQIGFCTIAPERMVESQNLKGRGFGEAILGGYTPEERERRMMAKDMLEMRAAIQRRREWMARQVLLTGKLELFRYTNEGRDKETTLEADYNFTNNFVPATNWDQAGAHIAEDLEAMYDMIYDGNGEVSIILMGSAAYSALRNNEAYMKTMDRDHALMGEIRTHYQGQGVRYIGTNTDGVDMFCLSGSFTNDEGNQELWMPSDKIIVGGRGILNILHGPVDQVEEEGMTSHHRTYIKKEVPLRYGSIESNTVKNRITSRPTVVPFNVDAWAVAEVV